MTEPKIFEYTNYRAFLSDLYRYRKAQSSKVSFRQLARAAGFSSPNFLKLVMDGQRNLSRSGIDQVAKAIRLKQDEATFFRNLVFFNQATRAEEKQFFAEQLLRSASLKRLKPLQRAQFEVFSHWYTLAIRELVTLTGFQENPAWIAGKLVPAITPAEAAGALETLLALGLLSRSPEGRLVQSEAQLTTGDEVYSVSVAKYHREMMARAADSIDRFPAEKRDISSVTLALSKEGAARIKKMVQEFRKEVLAAAAQEASPSGIYQFNFQVFPLSAEDNDEDSNDGA